MPHRTPRREVVFLSACHRSRESALMAEQGRYSAAAANARTQRLAVRGAMNLNGANLRPQTLRAATKLLERRGGIEVFEPSGLEAATRVSLTTGPCLMATCSSFALFR
jgi:hypothetical protein